MSSKPLNLIAFPVAYDGQHLESTRNYLVISYRGEDTVVQMHTISGHKIALPLSLIQLSLIPPSVVFEKLVWPAKTDFLDGTKTHELLRVLMPTGWRRRIRRHYDRRKGC